MQTLSPTTSKQRIPIVDILRGFALLGILMVNMHFFATPLQSLLVTPDMPLIDRVAGWIVSFGFQSKFFTLFSFLFGLGFFLQMSSAERKGVAFVPLYLRRLLWLAVFGLLHGIFLWVGDILLMYALMGLLLLLAFRHRHPRTLLIWTLLLIAVPTLLLGGSIVSLGAALESPQNAQFIANYEAQRAEEIETALANIEQDTLVYGSGTYGEVTAERMRDFITVWSSVNLLLMPSVLAMFLFGLRAGKRGWFDDVSANLPIFRRMLMWTLPLGVLLSVVYASSGADLTTSALKGVNFNFGVAYIANFLGAPLMMLANVSMIVLLSQTTWGARLLAPLADMGRMALSNYIMHSLVMTSIFYGYGFGLFGSVGNFGQSLMAIGLFLVQILLSRLWLSQFNFGPLEWLWRSLTYGKLQPMRKHSPTVAQVA